MPLWHTGSGETKTKGKKIGLPKIWPFTNQFFKSILWPRERPPSRQKYLLVGWAHSKQSQWGWFCSGRDATAFYLSIVDSLAMAGVPSVPSIGARQHLCSQVNYFMSMKFIFLTNQQVLWRWELLPQRQWKEWPPKCPCPPRAGGGRVRAVSNISWVSTGPRIVLSPFTRIIY